MWQLPLVSRPPLPLSFCWWWCASGWSQKGCNCLSVHLWHASLPLSAPHLRKTSSLLWSSEFWQLGTIVGVGGLVENRSADCAVIFPSYLWMPAVCPSPLLSSQTLALDELFSSHKKELLMNTACFVGIEWDRSNQVCALQQLPEWLALSCCGISLHYRQEKGKGRTWD